jgi:hypothetical protein
VDDAVQFLHGLFEGQAFGWRRRLTVFRHDSGRYA